MKSFLYISPTEQVLIPQSILLDLYSGKIKYEKYALKKGYIYSFNKEKSHVQFIQQIQFDQHGLIDQEHQMKMVLNAINPFISK